MPQKKIKKTIGLRLNIRWRKGNRLLGFRCGTNKRRRKNEIIFYDWWGVGCSVDGRLVSFWTSPNPATPSPRLRRTTLTRFKHHTNSTRTSITPTTLWQQPSRWTSPCMMTSQFKNFKAHKNWIHLPLAPCPTALCWKLQAIRILNPSSRKIYKILF